MSLSAGSRPGRFGRPQGVPCVPSIRIRSYCVSVPPVNMRWVLLCTPDIRPDVSGKPGMSGSLPSYVGCKHLPCVPPGSDRSGRSWWLSFWHWYAGPTCQRYPWGRWTPIAASQPLLGARRPLSAYNSISMFCTSWTNLSSTYSSSATTTTHFCRTVYTTTLNIVR